MPPGPLGQVLLDCAAKGTSGLLRVTGEPGGVIDLADGGITAISTPGAPDPEAILLRSGRVQEAGWSAAFAAAASDGRMGSELVRRELIGAGELEALLRLALADALFALAAGQVDDCQLEQSAADSLLPLQPAAEPGWLLAEAARRIQVLAALPNPIAHDRDRVASVQGAWTPRVGPGDGRAEILALANGRRSARDIAFVLGRGVYAVTLQLARMCDGGLLVIGSSRAAAARPPGPDPASAPASADDAASRGGDDASRGGDDAARPPLPRRRRGSTGQGQGGSRSPAARSPAATEPGSTQPRSTQPRSAQPRSAQPGSAQPGSRQPGSRQPAQRQPEKISVLRILRPGSAANRDPGKQTP